MYLLVIKDVFKDYRYILLAFFVALTFFTFSVWLANWQLVKIISSSSLIIFSEKLRLILSLYGSIATNFTPLAAIYTLIISTLLGTNTALLLKAISINQFSKSSAGGQLLGFVSGIIGIGCAACGSAILISFLSIIGAGGMLAAFPLGGGEFGIISVVFLCYSTYLLVKSIDNSKYCLM